jgi:hypothetical protein
MATLGFPKYPNIGDTYSPPGSTKTYQWSGSAWLIISTKTTATTALVDVLVVNSTTNAISTDTGALIVAGGVGIAKDLYVGGELYVAGVPIITTSSFNISDGPDGGTDINIQYYYDPLTSTSTIRINNISTLQSVTDRGATTDNVIYFTNTATSYSRYTGALIVSGGVGIAGRLNTESVKIIDTVFDSTKTTVDLVIENVIDTYLLSEYRSAKYMIQIAEDLQLDPSTSRFQSLEINLTAKNDGTPYITQYGQVTTDGELGTFSAKSDIVGLDILISLTFTPIDTIPKVVRVLRTAMTSAN